MNLDSILWLVGVLGEIGVVALCFRARLFRITPVFCTYLAWSLLTDLFFYFLGHSPNYFRIYIAQMLLDSAFQFIVLVELGWAVLRPIRSSLPKFSILILAFLIAAAGAAVWPLAGHMIPANLGPRSILLVHAQQTAAMLRVLVFLALAGFSQLLAIGWRNRELQIATGLGFYSMCSLAVFFVHSHQDVANSQQNIASANSYHLLDQVVVVSYLCSLAYWIFSFSQQEQERQEFTPQMRSFLLAVTGAARGTRMALADSSLGTTRKTGER